MRKKNKYNQSNFKTNLTYAILDLRKIYTLLFTLIICTVFLYTYFIFGAIFNTALSQNMIRSIATLNSNSAELETRISYISNFVLTELKENNQFIKIASRDFIKGGVYLGRNK